MLKLRIHNFYCRCNCCPQKTSFTSMLYILSNSSCRSKLVLNISQGFTSVWRYRSSYTIKQSESTGLIATASVFVSPFSDQKFCSNAKPGCGSGLEFLCCWQPISRSRTNNHSAHVRQLCRRSAGASRCAAELKCNGVQHLRPQTPFRRAEGCEGKAVAQKVGREQIPLASLTGTT